LGSYGITQGTLAASPNYAFTYVGTNLTVTAAPLTVTVDAQSRIYGTVNPTLTYVSSGLVNGDALAGGLATMATTTSNVGPYAITQGTLAASANYALTYVSANLTVTAAPLTAPVAQPIVIPPPLTIASPQLAAFPSYFTSNDFLGTGDNGFVSANFAADPDASACTSTAVLQSLNRYGRVDLTGENAASCNAASHK
jgi:MBG domain (YGX type)